MQVLLWSSGQYIGLGLDKEFSDFCLYYVIFFFFMRKIGRISLFFYYWWKQVEIKIPFSRLYVSLDQDNGIYEGKVIIVMQETTYKM